MTTLANEPHPPNYFTLALQQCHQGTGQKAMEWQHKHIPIRKTKIYHKYNKQRTSHITFAGLKWMAASCMPTILQCTVATLSPCKCQGMHHPCSVYQQTEGCTQQLGMISNLICCPRQPVGGRRLWHTPHTTLQLLPTSPDLPTSSRICNMQH